MEALFIKGRVDSYSPKWCVDTLTVGGLIEILQEYDEDMPVYLNHSNGYSYGSITEDDIYKGNADE